MKKEVNLVVGNYAISAFGTQCVNVVGDSNKLELIANCVCPHFQKCKVIGRVEELWFYRGVLIYKDCNPDFPFCVPSLFGNVCCFYSLRGAKAAVSRSQN